MTRKTTIGRRTSSATALIHDRTQSDRDVTTELTAYLSRAGWRSGPAGPLGTLWHHPDAPAKLAVPFEVKLGTREWSGIVERLSAWSRLSVRAVVERVEYQFVDVTRLSAANDMVIDGTIPLSAGRVMVASAELMLRAAGTTSQRLRSSINGNFSRVGDGVIAQARMGHTEEGSYVVPVLMPLSPVDDNEASSDPPLGGTEMFRNPPEPTERRVTRTLAQALVALQAHVVQPAREVRKAELHPFIQAGGSRELVNALTAVLTQPAVATFEVAFTWAEAVSAPTTLPEAVEVPSQARELLEQASRLLRDMRVSVGQVLTGPIVLVRMQPGDPFGEIGIQTVRSGRPAEVHVRLNAADIDRAHTWAIDKRVIVVEGSVRAHRGHPLMIDEPTRVQPVDETMLQVFTT